MSNLFDVSNNCLIFDRSITKRQTKVYNKSKSKMNTSINEKFQSLVHGNTHIGTHGIAGTNNELRAAIWAEIVKANPDNILIRMKTETENVEIFLNANHSISGLTTTYFRQLTDIEYMRLTGGSYGLKRNSFPSIDIQNGDVTISGGGKHFQRITNDLISIIESNNA